MLQAQYVMITALCAFACAQGAASDQAQCMLKPERLQLSDCFSLQQTRVPGQQQFYEPVIVSKLFALGMVDRLFGDYTSLQSTKIVRGVCGLVSGSDAALTKEAAQLISMSMQSWSMEELSGNCEDHFGRIDIGARECTERIVQRDVTRLGKILQTQCTLIAFQSRDDARDPQRVSATSLATADFKRITIPLYLAGKLKDVESCHAADASTKERLDVLAAYAATVAVFHDAFYLQFDPEMYTKFLDQEFSA